MQKSSRYFRNDRDVVAALSSGEKLISFIFQLNVHLDYFQKLTRVSAALPTQGRTAESSPKKSSIIWRVVLSFLLNRNVHNSAETSVK